jgi:hypothetical protein
MIKPANIFFNSMEDHKMAEKVSILVTGRVPDGKDFKPRAVTAEFNHRQAVVELKQLINSLAEIGIVNQIEDRKSPFNGMLVDMIHICRDSELEESDNFIVRQTMEVEAGVDDDD